MWKAIVAGSTALVIAGSTLALAQQRGSEGQRSRPSAEDVRAFGEARIAALKAGLSLTADQEKNWPAFEQAARDFAKFRLDRFAAVRQAQASADPIDRTRTRAKAMADSAASLQKLADATEPLYRSLDEAQKRRFTILARGFTPGEGRGFEGRRRHWGGPQGHDRPRRFDRMRGEGTDGNVDPRFHRNQRSL